MLTFPQDIVFISVSIHSISYDGFYLFSLQQTLVLISNMLTYPVTWESWLSLDFPGGCFWLVPDLCSTHCHPAVTRAKTQHPWCEEILTASHQGDHLSQPTAIIPGISLVEHHIPLMCPLGTGYCLLVAPLFFITVCIWQINLASLQGHLRGPEYWVFQPQGWTIPAPLVSYAVFCFAQPFYFCRTLAMFPAL